MSISNPMGISLQVRPRCWTDAREAPVKLRGNFPAGPGGHSHFTANFTGESPLAGPLGLIRGVTGRP